MFIISLSYGTKNLIVSSSDSKLVTDLIDSARKETEKKCMREFEAILKQKKTGKPGERIEQLQEELAENRAILREKNNEIQRLESMNSTISIQWSTMMKFVTMRGKVKLLDVAKCVVDDNGNELVERRHDDIRPGNAKQYHGIACQEFDVEGSVDLTKVRMWETPQSINITGFVPNEPEPISPKDKWLLSQLCGVRIRKEGKDDPKLNIDERIILEKNSAKGREFHRQKLEKKPEYIFDESTKDCIVQMGIKIMQMYLMPFGKKVEYVPEPEPHQSTCSLLDFYREKIAEKKLELKEIEEADYQVINVSE